MCGEVLLGLCKRASEDGSLQGIRIARGSPSNKPSVFVDDTMFFRKSNNRRISGLEQILILYEKTSGQCINSKKIINYFLKKAPPELKDKVKKELDITQEGEIGKYLGLPEHFRRKKRDMFALIVDKIKQKASSWSSRFLSTAGKLVLLKSVLAAMPTYKMSCFKLPMSLCKHIQSALTRF